MSPRSSLRVALVAIALSLALAPAGASASPYAKGPDPTGAVLTSTTGPYDITRARVADSASRAFGPAQVWAPVAAPGETFGGVALSPGFLADGTTLTWLARRLASQGFVVIVFTPNSIFDKPASRGKALLAALEYLRTTSTARALVDPTRLAVVGHSMGGGGVLEAALRDHTLKATVAIFPWDLRKSFSSIETPTLILGSRPDWIAPISLHALPFYRSLPSALPREYLELNVDHAAPILPVDEVSRATTNWLKRFVDDDERYTAALCPTIGGVRTTTITGFQSSCGEGPLAP